MAKKIVHYLIDIIYLKLVYEAWAKDKRDTKILLIPFLFQLIRYKNSNYARDPKNRKLVLQYYYFINRAIILWHIKKEKTILILIIKAKYIVFKYSTLKAI